VGRRAGDVASCYADATKAHKILGWKAEYNLEDMVKDSYKFAYYSLKEKTNFKR